MCVSFVLTCVLTASSLFLFLRISRSIFHVSSTGSEEQKETARSLTCVLNVCLYRVYWCGVDFVCILMCVLNLVL